MLSKKIKHWNKFIDFINFFDVDLKKVIINGSLALFEIRPNNDIDMVIEKQYFKNVLLPKMKIAQKLKNSKIKTKEIPEKTMWEWDEDVEFSPTFVHWEFSELINDVYKIGPYNFLSLNQIIEFKKTLGREKDLKDIQLIQNFLK